MSDPAAKVIVNVSFQGEEWDYDEHVELDGVPFRLIRVGTSGDAKKAEAQVWSWSLTADAIAVSGVREAKAAGHFTGGIEDFRKVKGTTTRVPVQDDSLLGDVFQEWAIRQVQTEMPGYFSNARVVVVGTTTRERTIAVLREFTDNIVFERPRAELKLPGSFKTNPVAATASGLTELAWNWTPGLLKEAVGKPAGWGADRLAHHAATNADVIVGSFSELMRFGLPELKGKAVITSAVSEDRLETLARLGADLVVDVTPQPFDFVVVPATYEAMVAATLPAGAEVTTDALAQFIERAGLRPRLLWPNGQRRKSRFSFVIHPLSTEYFKNVEPLGAVMKVPGMSQLVEKAVAYAPPFIYSHVTGIVSDTGDEAEGWLITVGGTPREMLAHPPEFTYSRLLEAAEMSRKLGAQIMGLGAFTKVVGDAGVTVAKRAALPVTTGNSYSASGALWAAHAAIRRLGIAEVDEDGSIHGKAMVVGASGAIGSVCARLLALAADELWLVSPETAKLLALKADIERENPRARVRVATSPAAALPEMDVIVTATSAAGHKVLDIMQVKPGAVITDVARPLDLSAEDVARRPDVLVIESGEVELPGSPRMRDIGLPEGVAYACLAETIVLALEGRYENFTVGRHIEWEKVKEIYRLGLKHGMQLAAISGVNGPYTDEDFARVREAALAARTDAPATRGNPAPTDQSAPAATIEEQS
ncbi:dehydrogenase [Ornithinimicrobium ciconiae]|uniref:Dehydrogenase n=1 Tax=Ornithinimicrobium ciconiae TaxID=2594265 RepID=A0A516GD73_9MICO|nr:dehydrogenase [Ornithinimicrobium ciconiae]QDO89473.1 dehydrogenase [Ornithinimicrobium ciconiae]